MQFSYSGMCNPRPGAGGSFSMTAQRRCSLLLLDLNSDGRHLQSSYALGQGVYGGPCGSRPRWAFAIAHDKSTQGSNLHIWPGSLETNAARSVCVLTTVQRLGCVIAACMYPGIIASCALSLEYGGFAHDEILSSCRRGTCSLVAFSSGLPRRLAVVCCLLAWAGMDGWTASGSCGGGKHDGFFGRRVC